MTATLMQHVPKKTAATLVLVKMFELVTGISNQLQTVLVMVLMVVITCIQMVRDIVSTL